MRDYTPWYLVIRYLPVDLPKQLENVISMRSWRNHLVDDPTGPKYLTRLPGIQGCYNQNLDGELFSRSRLRNNPDGLQGVGWLLPTYGVIAVNG